MGFGFAYPGILLVVVVIGGILWMLRSRKKDAALDLPTARWCRDLVLPATRHRTRVVNGLGLAALAFLAAALAGPRLRQTWNDSTEGISLAFVVDVSASMGNKDFSQNGEFVSRLAGTQRNFRLLVDGGDIDGLHFPGRPNDSISLVTFATRPETACPPTLDHHALLMILDRQTPKTITTDAASNPGDAIAWALAALENSPTRRKAIVLLTDGESNVGAPALAPAQAAKLAAALKIPIYTIDALNDADESEAIAAAHQRLIDVAKISGGRNFRAVDGAAMLAALHDLDALERDVIAGSDDLAYADATLQVGLAALVFWLSWIAGRATLGRAVP